MTYASAAMVNLTQAHEVVRSHLLHEDLVPIIRNVRCGRAPKMSHFHSLSLDSLRFSSLSFPFISVNRFPLEMP